MKLLSLFILPLLSQIAFADAEEPSAAPSEVEDVECGDLDPFLECPLHPLDCKVTQEAGEPVCVDRECQDFDPNYECPLHPLDCKVIEEGGKKKCVDRECEDLDPYYECPLYPLECKVIEEGGKKKCVDEDAPTKSPTKKPTKKPTMKPTKKPTKKPTMKPTKKPTRKPTKKPTRKPTLAPNPKPNPNPNPNPSPDPGDICVINLTQKACNKERCCKWVRVPSKFTPNCIPKCKSDGTMIDEEDFLLMLNEYEEDLLEKPVYE